MVQCDMSVSQARERLLDAAVEQAMNGGITDLSLRELAAAIGTSHRMLIYHFGSREGLLVAVTRKVEEAQRALVASWGIDARRSWQHITDPGLWPQERLFFELYAHALLGRPGTQGFAEAAIEPWVAMLADNMASAGLSQEQARAQARLGLAVTRGLLLDMLGSGDRTQVTEAFECYLALVEHFFAEDHLAGGGGQPSDDHNDR
jgi:AcrR family transcriptional regulator